MKFDSVIFDLDGTLWDATEQIASCWASCIKYVSVDFIKSLMGKTNEEICLKAKISSDKLDECQNKELTYLLGNPGKLYPGVIPLLCWLADTGVPSYIVSNCQKGYVDTFLKAYNMGRFFKGHTCSGATGKSKAQNIADLIATEKLSSPVYVGDTAGDKEAAESNNIVFIHSVYGFCPSIDAKYKANTPNDIRKILLEG